MCADRQSRHPGCPAQTVTLQDLRDTQAPYPVHGSAALQPRPLRGAVRHTAVGRY